VDTAVALIIATIIGASITLLVLGMFRSQRRPEAGPSRWAARAALAEMRKDGAHLPTEVGDMTDRTEAPPADRRPGTPT